MSQSLVKLQAIFGGKFPIVRAKGDNACAIVDIMQRISFENETIYKFENNPQISQCIIIDRTVDMITPCLTPRTYEGLLDEVFQIDTGIYIRS